MPSPSHASLRHLFAPRIWLMIVLAQACLLAQLCAASPFPLEERREFEGIVQFEARHTLVPMVICEDLPGHCPRSQTYWVVSLVNILGHAEWSQPFALGRATRPQFLEVHGKRLRVGQRVRLIGEGRSLTQDWFLIEEIEELEILD
jgi:hypothetical protein